MNEKKLEAYLLTSVKPEIKKYIASFNIKQEKPAPKADLAKIKTKMQRLKELYINALLALNTNLDLNIKEYVAVNFQAVATAVDQLGGVTLNIKQSEINYINELIEIDDYRIEYEKYKKELELASAETLPKKDLSAVRSFLELDLENVYSSLSPQEKRSLWGSIINKIIIDNSRNIEFIFF